MIDEERLDEILASLPETKHDPGCVCWPCRLRALRDALDDPERAPWLYELGDAGDLHIW